MQFSIHRVWLLVRKQWAENKQLYILGLLAYAGIMAAVITFNLMEYEGFEKRAQENILIVGLMGGGFVFTTTILSQLNQKLTCTNMLMLPASALEKLAMATIYSMVLFPVCFLSAVYPLIVLGQYIDHHIIGHLSSLYVIKANAYTFYILIAFWVLQSVALFATVLFKRYALVKAIILVAVVFYGTLILNPILARSIIKIHQGTPFVATVRETYFDTNQNVVERKISKEVLWSSIWSATPFSDLEITNWAIERKINGVDYEAYGTEISNPYSSVFVVLLVMSFPFLWLITWFRLKEREL